MKGWDANFTIGAMLIVGTFVLLMTIIIAILIDGISSRKRR